MQYHRATYRLAGVAPLIMHSGVLADPMNPICRAMKKISNKPAKQKTEADHIQHAHLEFIGGLCYSAEDGVHLPHDYIEAMLVNAAKSQRKGKVFNASMFVEQATPLIYEGPRLPEELWEDEAFRLVKSARVNQGRVVRCRPIFNTWSAEPVITYDRQAINPSELDELMKFGGEQIGLADWRPRHGRFTVKKLSDEAVALPLAA